jgi:hypothetical protein
MWISFRCKLGGKVDQFWMQINTVFEEERKLRELEQKKKKGK